MKKVLVSFILVTIICITPAYACTSFAVYSEQPLYAMNFDYSPTEIRFCVVEDREKDLSVFSMTFKYGYRYASTVVMNNKGQFGCSQMQYPAETGKSARSEDEIFSHEILGLQMKESYLEEVLLQLEKKRFVHWENVTAHVLLADVSGNAAIIEAGADENEIVAITDDFIVMTNFKNSDFRGQSYDRVAGTGSDRYIKAYDHIVANKDNFSIDAALEGLEKTAQRSTLCSMVFAPKENNIYFALNQDFSKLWKLSIDDKTIETFRGFGESAKFPIPEEGVLAADLLKSNAEEDEGADEGADEDASGLREVLFYGALVLAAIAVIFISIVYMKRKSRAA